MLPQRVHCRWGVDGKSEWGGGRVFLSFAAPCRLEAGREAPHLQLHDELSRQVPSQGHDKAATSDLGGKAGADSPIEWADVL